MIWFVDLSLHPELPIKHRAVLSSAPDVGGMDSNDRKRTAGHVVPDNTESRFWLRASSASEALRKAQERAGR